ncbi:RHS repeat-associated core domain-containing protein [Algicola sagamiensis]|uniref:RHS repeat-associated core domain-containing protein n=1 Tax=Algicola sagamiensis TaxID=163869 RepID=UPI000364BC3E|nr:RHS repeat-associated core domain-containing protein [Algicola sagamiensis]
MILKHVAFRTQGAGIVSIGIKGVKLPSRGYLVPTKTSAEAERQISLISKDLIGDPWKRDEFASLLKASGVSGFISQLARNQLEMLKTQLLADKLVCFHEHPPKTMPYLGNVRAADNAPSAPPKSTKPVVSPAAPEPTFNPKQSVNDTPTPPAIEDQALRADPVSMLTGEEILTCVDIGKRSPIRHPWQRIYRSSNAQMNVGMGYGWRHAWQVSLIECEESFPEEGQDAKRWMVYTDEQGREHTFDYLEPKQTCYQSSSGLTLEGQQFGVTRSYALIFPDKTRYIFKAASKRWRLVEIHTNPQWWVLNYDDTDRVIDICWRGHRGVQLIYQSEGWLSAVTPYQIVENVAVAQDVPLVQYRYDSIGHLIGAIDAQGREERYDYDNQHRLIRRERAEDLAHDLSWLNGQCVAQRGSDGVYASRMTFDAATNISTCTDSRGYTETFEHNKKGQLVRYTNGNGHTWHYGYTQAGWRSQTMDPLGHSKYWTYNGQGQCLSYINALGQTTRYDYDRWGHCIRTQRPDGQSITRILDLDGTLRAEQYPDNQACLIEYDGLNLPTKYIDFDRSHMTLTWDQQLQLLMTDIAGVKTRYSYHKDGQLNGILEPSGLGHLFHHNKKGQVERVLQTDFAAYQAAKDKDTVPTSAHHYVYDKAGRLTQYTAPDGRIASATYTYDTLPETITRPDGNTLFFNYDTERNLLSLSRHDGIQVTFAYDGNENITQMTGLDGRTLDFQYDPCDRVTQVTEGDRQVQLTYDPLGRLTSKRASKPDNVVERTFTYNTMGQITRAFSADAQVLQFWDEGGKLKYSEQSGGHALKYQYDRFGRRTHLHLPDGQTVLYTYDKHSRLAQISLDAQSICQWEYDQSGNPKTLIFGHGCLLLQQFDLFGRLTRQSLYDTQQTALQSTQYTYDKADQLTQKKQQGVIDSTIQYSYNQRQQLTQVTMGTQQHIYDWDTFGNPQSAKVAIQGDRIVSIAKQACGYDKQGNQIRSLGQSYQFDALSQLITVNTEQGQTQYTYDAFGRRQTKQQGERLTHYLWDKDQLVGECQDGQWTWFIYMPDSFDPIAMVKAGIVYTYQLDQLGTPQLLLDLEGTIVWQNQSDVYGLAAANASNTIEQPLRFAGQYADEETGLHYNRYRYYSPKQQRFISPDPLGILGGIHPYQYAPNPVNWVDPLGLLCKEGLEKLGQMLTALEKDGLTPEMREKVLEAAQAGSNVNSSDEQTKSLIKRRKPGGTNFLVHEYDKLGLDPENGTVTMYRKVGDDVSPKVLTIKEFAGGHLVDGSLVNEEWASNGELITAEDSMRDPDAKPTKFHKRTVGEVDNARSEFSQPRKEYVSKFAKDALNDESHEAHLYFGKKELMKMEITGRVPEGYNVHHKKPIFRCPIEENPNKISNLQMLPDEFHKDYNRELHWYEEGNCPYDENGNGPNLNNYKGYFEENNERN